MCGIVGWAKLDPGAVSDQREDEVMLRSMCARIAHRGPDSEGVFVGRSSALGIRRLAIIDLVTGEQPFFNEDESNVVVLNGEIYNFKVLREDLLDGGHQLRSHSDTEVLPHLYENFGLKLVEKLNGMFAFALWDARRERLFMARDRMGKKPLYYGVFGGKLIFASELKAMLAHPDVETRLNIHAMKQYLAFDFVPAPHSIYEGIFKLPAAHLLTLEKGEIKIEKYWDLNFKKDKIEPTIDEAAEELRGLLDDATRLRMISDVDLGVLLSGGLDSSTVAAYAQKNSMTPIKTFCIGFEESSFDESSHARLVAKHLGTDHYEDRLSVQQAADLIPNIAGWLDEPLADPSILPTYLLSRFVRSKVTVALGGDGADEIFAGYPSYYAHKMAERYEKLPLFLRRHVIENAIKLLPASRQNMAFDFLAKQFLRSLENKDIVARHLSFFGSFTFDELGGLLSESVRAGEPTDIYAEARDWADNAVFDTDIPSNNLVERMQFLDMKFYLAEDIMTKVDRASMAVSLEVRAPFLDTRIVEFAARLPRDFKLNCKSPKFALGRTGKYILKKAVEPLLPPSIAGRKKNGFVIPLASWLRGELRPLVRDMLSRESILSQGLFDPDYVEKLIREHESGASNHAKTIWSLLVFEMWNKNFGPARTLNRPDTEINLLARAA